MNTVGSEVSRGWLHTSSSSTCRLFRRAISSGAAAAVAAAFWFCTSLVSTTSRLVCDEICVVRTYLVRGLLLFDHSPSVFHVPYPVAWADRRCQALSPPRLNPLRPSAIVVVVKLTGPARGHQRKADVAHAPPDSVSMT